MSNVTEPKTPSEATTYDKDEATAIKNTHQFLTVKGMEVLKHDKMGTVDEKIKKNFDIIFDNMEELKRGSIAPDYGVVGIDRDYGLYQDHFFDPDTQKNFTSLAGYPSFEVKDNAESQARNYFSRAIATWLDGDKVKGIYYLGKALHYFEDANEPHHCLNWTGGEGTAHTRFEYKAEEVKERYAISTISPELYDQFKDEKFISFISKMVFKHSRMAKALEPYVSLKQTWDEWFHAMEVALGHAQEGVAVIIYRFLQEVTYPVKTEISKPLGKFHVIIKTGDMKNAATDNEIYFGVKTKNGGKYTRICDLPGDDFTTGSTGSYQLEIPEDVTFEDIEVAFLEKRAGVTVFENSMFLESVEVYMQGFRVCKECPNKWISNGDRIALKINK